MRAFITAVFTIGAFTSAAQAQDTLVVRADSPPVWGPEPRLIEELRIGTLEGDPRYSFGEISGVAPGANDVWIADDPAAVIRRFSLDGRHLGDVGRKGEGPGEFASIAGLQRLSDGRVAAWDVRRKRVSVFAEDGRFVSSLTPPLNCSVFTTVRFTSFVVGPDDSYFIRSCAPPVGGSGVPPQMWVHLDASGSVIDTLPSVEDLAGFVRLFAFGPMAPYTAHGVGALSPLGYLVTGRTDRYALHRPLRDGRTVRVERSWSPISVRTEERSMLEGAMEADRRRIQGAQAQGFVGMQVSPSPRIPAVKPPLWAFRVDQDGRIWVARHQEGYHRPETEAERTRRMNRPFGGPGALMEWSEPLVTDVLEPSGRFLGTVRFPNDRTTIAWARGDTLWAVELGERDEAYLVRYRLEHR
jgi:hypothetical protein